MVCILYNPSEQPACIYRAQDVMIRAYCLLLEFHEESYLFEITKILRYAYINGIMFCRVSSFQISSFLLENLNPGRYTLLGISGPTCGFAQFYPKQHNYSYSKLPNKAGSNDQRRRQFHTWEKHDRIMYCVIIPADCIQTSKSIALHTWVPQLQGKMGRIEASPNSNIHIVLHWHSVANMQLIDLA